MTVHELVLFLEECPANASVLVSVNHVYEDIQGIDMDKNVTEIYLLGTSHEK